MVFSLKRLSLTIQTLFRWEKAIVVLPTNAHLGFGITLTLSMRKKRRHNPKYLKINGKKCMLAGWTFWKQVAISQLEAFLPTGNSTPYKNLRRRRETQSNSFVPTAIRSVGLATPLARCCSKGHRRSCVYVLCVTCCLRRKKNALVTVSVRAAPVPAWNRIATCPRNRIHA